MREIGHKAAADFFQQHKEVDDFIRKIGQTGTGDFPGAQATFDTDQGHFSRAVGIALQGVFHIPFILFIEAAQRALDFAGDHRTVPLDSI